MAHECHDREDLLRDARALTPRVQVQVTLRGRGVALFAGFRGETLSLYFGADPVFHFNARGELRRAFVGGRLLKADDGRLLAMERVHTPKAVELQAESLSDDAQRALLADLAERLALLRKLFASGAFTVDGQVPENGDAVERLAAWLQLERRPAVADSPRVHA